MNRKRSLLFTLLLLLFLTGCQPKDLKGEAESVQTEGGTYSFHLPTGWTSVAAYKKQFNQAAVFGAEDTQSRSVLFIRSQKEEKKNEQELRKWAEASLTPYYDIVEATPDVWMIGDNPCLHYQIKSVYKDEAVWLELYVIATETEVLEFLFYRPRESGTEGQLSILTQSVQSLKQVSEQKNTEESREQKQGISTEELAIRVAGTKRLANQLIIRFVFTNKQGQTVLPIEGWKKHGLLLEGNQPIEPILVEESTTDTELFYLQQAGRTPVKEGETVECAVVYPLKGADQEIQLKMTTAHGSQSLRLNE